MKLSILLYGVALAIRFAALFFPSFKERLEQRNLVAQFKLQDNSIGRYFELQGGRVRSKAGIHANPDVTIFFKNERIALRVLTPPQDYGELVHAGKNFQMGAEGEDEKVCWWMQTLGRLNSLSWKFGQDG